jgi:hypothetical protein
MLSKCANPGCSATFLYLYQGKLFRLDTSIESLARIPVREVTRPSRRILLAVQSVRCGTDARLQQGNRNHGGAPA